VMSASRASGSCSCSTYALNATCTRNTNSSTSYLSL
jgi:hypothetical protein